MFREVVLTLAARIVFFGRRLSGLFIVLGVVLSLPDIATDGPLRYKNAAAAFAFVLMLGKLLYDTFFFERVP